MRTLSALGGRESGEVVPRQRAGDGRMRPFTASAVLCERGKRHFSDLEGLEVDGGYLPKDGGSSGRESNGTRGEAGTEGLLAAWKFGSLQLQPAERQKWPNGPTNNATGSQHTFLPHGDLQPTPSMPPPCISKQPHALVTPGHMFRDWPNVDPS
jgi:hypothetical protein